MFYFIFIYIFRVFIYVFAQEKRMGAGVTHPHHGRAASGCLSDPVAASGLAVPGFVVQLLFHVVSGYAFARLRLCSFSSRWASRIGCAFGLPLLSHPSNIVS